VWFITAMSTESFNRTSDNLKTPNINLDVLKQKINTPKPKKICINNLNKRLHLAKKRDKFKNNVIIFSVFVSITLVGFIAG
tara:strand:- start:189 stop:431 length:243 start_codon:yes stop_codon:yes gene_type:complete